MQVDTIGSSFDTELAVLTGNSVGSLTQVASAPLPANVTSVGRCMLLAADLLNAGWVPVISPLARDREASDGAGLNVNGDDAAASIAAGLGADVHDQRSAAT